MGHAEREHHRSEQEAEPAEGRRHQNGPAVLHLRRQDAHRGPEAQADRYPSHGDCGKGGSSFTLVAHSDKFHDDVAILFRFTSKWRGRD